MNHKLKISVALTLLLMLVLQACSPSSPESPELPTIEPSPGAALLAEPQALEAGLCSNPLYPAKQGATWTYQSTGGLSGDLRFTDTITEVREDGFTLSSQVDGRTLAQEWTCTPEGLASLSFGNGAAGGISTSGVEMDLTTSNAQGVILPQSINPEDEWAYSLDFEGTMEYTDTVAETQGTASFAFNALGEESVTVPAGTFNAMKIHVDLVLEMQATFSGFTAPLMFTIPTDIWYAPDVGWVKASSSGNIFGLAFNESIELQSYNIP
jgi:hypothetical protein